MGSGARVRDHRLLRGGLWLSLLVATLVARPARAEVPPADRAAADLLFRDGLRLLSEGKLDQACPKFAESQRLDPAPGTLLNLGDCEERRGNLASAYGAFLEARIQADREGDRKGRSAEAVRRAKLLEPRLSMLVIKVAAESQAPGLEVRRDGRPLSRGLWGTGVPVDPGAHTIEASAPGHRGFSATVQIAPKPGETAVEVPALAVEPAARPAAAGPVSAPAGSAAGKGGASPERGWSTQQKAGIVVVSVGVAGAVVGTMFGAITLSEKASSDKTCHRVGSDVLCSEEDYKRRMIAYTAANISNVAFAIGGAGLIGGVVLLVTAKPRGGDRPAAGRSIELHPVVGGSMTGLAATGRW